jgi:hypothetical protein
MQYKIAVVHQNPVGGVVAFHAHRALAYLLQLRLNFVTDSLRLPRAAGRANDKIISEGSDRAKVKNSNIGGLFGFGSKCCYFPVGQI